MVKQKILIIRFSSFGDIVQAMSVLRPLKERNPESEIHWLTRSEFAPLVKLSPYVDKVIEYDRKSGLQGLLKKGLSLRKEKYQYIFDAHVNLRSRLLKFLFIGIPVLVRPKSRIKRFLLFTFRINKFPRPFKGMESYLKPLGLVGKNLIQEWSFQKTSFSKVEGMLPEKDFIAIAPSAAWEMKRWPLAHWKELIRSKSDEIFVVLGGPGDTFCQELVEVDPDRILNLAGELSLVESCLVVKRSKMLVSADTGLIHVADLLGIKGISLIGPTAFGFPTNKNITALEADLNCRPCTKDGRGKCSQDIYQRCMVEITPESVADTF